MIAVIFESHPLPEKRDAYLNAATTLKEHLAKIDGFLSIERFESLTQPGKLLALSFWRDEQAVENWRNQDNHRHVQDHSRRTIFHDYRLRVAHVVRDYGLNDRAEAPRDSNA